ncbi:MAG: alcohol dehydrogenase catalytic domain-containing protein [Rhodospirillaceae bacterium]
MKAMVLRSPGTPFVLETRPDPVPGPGEAVARVVACGAGLTIHHVRAGRARVDYPRIIGHEVAGEIVAVGRDVAGLAVGDPVTVWFYLTCGHCRWCLGGRETLCENFGGFIGRAVDGAYAEYVKLPARNFLKLPDDLDWKARPAEASVICDAVATPYKVIRRARVAPTDTVAVIGAGGGLGIHMVMMAKWAHARVIAVDRAAEKLPACLTAGADAVVDASRNDATEALIELTGGKGVDVAIDFVSSTESLERAAAALGVGGRLVTLGGSGQPFRANSAAMLAKELELIGSRYATRQEVLDSLALVARGDIAPLVTETYPLEQAEAAHQRLEHEKTIGRAALLIG